MITIHQTSDRQLSKWAFGSLSPNKFWNIWNVENTLEATIFPRNVPQVFRTSDSTPQLYIFACKKTEEASTYYYKLN